MKKLLLTALCMLFLVPCAAQTWVRRGFKYAYEKRAEQGDPIARRKLAARAIERKVDPKTGAYVSRSRSWNYVFFVRFGSVKLENTDGDFINLYIWKDQMWQLEKMINRRGPFEDVLAYTNGQPQIISFSRGENGAINATVHSAMWQGGKWKKKSYQTYYTF